MRRQAKPSRALTATEGVAKLLPCYKALRKPLTSRQVVLAVFPPSPPRELMKSGRLTCAPGEAAAASVNSSKTLKSWSKTMKSSKRSGAGGQALFVRRAMRAGEDGRRGSVRVQALVDGDDSVPSNR